MFTLVSGTNRSPSMTLRVTQIFARLFEAEGAEHEILDLAQLPAEIFDPQSYKIKPPAFVEKFSSRVLASEGLLFVVPEYNGSFPGVVKYFIDMLKFPESFEQKPVAFVGLASGMWGALRGVEQLEGVFRYRNAFIFNERVFLPSVETQFDDRDEFKTPLVGQLARRQVKNFITYARALDGAFGQSKIK